MKKLVKVLIVLILIGALGFGVYCFFNVRNNPVEQTEANNIAGTEKNLDTENQQEIEEEIDDTLTAENEQIQETQDVQEAQ